MRASRWRRSLVAVATAGLIGFGSSGCTSDADPPEPAPLPTASPSPTLTPSAAAPSLPPEAQGKSAKAAKAFARHFFEAVNYATRTGDTGTLKALGSDECDSCDAIAKTIDDVYSEGGRIETKGWKLTVVTLVPGQPRSSPILDLGVTQSPESVVASAGAELKHYPGGKQPMTMYLARDGSAWHVNRLDLVA